MAGRAVIAEPATLIVLAGGESKRMGFPKYRLEVGGRDILTHLHERLGPLFAETVIVGRDIEAVPYGVRVVEDRFIVRSPLVGIHGGLAASLTDLAFVVACDMPHVDSDLARCLLDRANGADVSVPVVRGFYEPLCAAYRRSCLRPIERLIDRGTLKVTSLYELVDVRNLREEDVRACDPALRSFVNLNTLARDAAWRRSP